MDTLLLQEQGDLAEMQPLIDRFFSIIPGIDHPQAVPVVMAHMLTETRFKRDWVSQNRPCLIKGAVKHWPAVQKWRNKEYWLNQCDDFEVNVYPHENFINDDHQKSGQERMPFHTAVERLFQNTDYVLSMPGERIFNGGRFSKVQEDLPGFHFLKKAPMPRWYPRLRFFIYRRAATNWHYHGVDETLMCQVNGAKKVALLSPHITRPAYVTDFLVRELYLKGDKLDPQLDLKPLVVEVREGDALYIPPYWHHVVVPMDGQIGFTVAFCWSSPLHILGKFSSYFVRNTYWQGIKPFHKRTLLIPFIALVAGAAYCFARLTGKKY